MDYLLSTLYLQGRIVENKYLASLRTQIQVERTHLHIVDKYSGSEVSLTYTLHQRLNVSKATKVRTMCRDHNFCVFSILTENAMTKRYRLSDTASILHKRSPTII
jgi:hypothetical protein